jgi:hypothetical protein
LKQRECCNQYRITSGWNIDEVGFVFAKIVNKCDVVFFVTGASSCSPDTSDGFGAKDEICVSKTLDYYRTMSSDIELMIGEQNYRVALEASRRGINTIGYSYREKGVIDDTGMILSMSSSKEVEGDLEAASKLAYRSLLSRIEQLRQKCGEILD